MADTKQTINCPACDKEMKKIYVEDLNINIDICTEGCGGIYFDNREFEKFDEEHEDADAIFNEFKNKTFTKTDEQEVRICPVCNTPMVKMGAGKGGVTIDVCNVCGGKFLDNGELERIRSGRSADSKDLDEIIDTLMDSRESKKAITEPVRQSFEDFVRKLL